MTSLVLNNWAQDNNRNEPPHEKNNKMNFAPSDNWSAWEAAQSDQSIRLGIPPVWSVFTVCMKTH